MSRTDLNTFKQYLRDTVKACERSKIHFLKNLLMSLNAKRMSTVTLSSVWLIDAFSYLSLQQIIIKL